MRYDSESERYVSCSERIVLECGCGERLVLLGREEDWYSEGRTAFECGGCGRRLTLANRSYEGGSELIDQEDGEFSDVRKLLRSIRTTDGE